LRVVDNAGNSLDALLSPYCMDASVLWLPEGTAVELEAGYRLDRICFNEPSASGFDLDIRYGGPFVELSYRF